MGSATNKARRARLWKLFRVTPSDCYKILAVQGGVCAISSKPAKKIRLSVDHDHRTGLIRGLLTIAMNKGLGYFNDDPKLLRAAADYLENPPAIKALGKPRYGLLGQAKIKKVMKYGGPTDYQLTLLKSKGKNVKKQVARKNLPKQKGV